MLSQIPSQIFKSNLRGNLVTKNYQCFSVFNYLNYQEESRMAFGNLSVFNDETIASKEEINYKITKNQIVVLLPLVGGIEVKESSKVEFISLNSIKIFSIEAGKTFTITNPYETDLVNFLQLRFNENSLLFQNIEFHLTENKVVNLIKNDFFSISLGIFDARFQDEYQLKLKNSGCFAFVIAGAFEFQNRLIENRDGLKIWNVQEVDFEALSENAMLLIVESSL